MTIKNDVQTVSEILDSLKEVISTSEAVFSIDDDTSGIKIKSKCKMTIYMRGTLAHFLGFNEDHKDENVVRIKLRIGEELILPFIPRFLEQYPNSLFLYSGNNLGNNS